MKTVLIIDDDPATREILRAPLAAAGFDVESVGDGCAAMERLSHDGYSAVVLDPMIRHRLNGYAVLNFIELERPQLVPSLYLFTGMSEQTIKRTAPAVLPRLYRKPHDTARLISAIVASGGAPHAFGSVLIVEDDPATAALLHDFVCESGYAATVASSGFEALDRLRTHDFDAILLDLVLPDLDGFAVLEELKATKPYLLPRVIVSTGMPERYLARLDQTIVCAIVRKPVDVVTLRRLLRDCGECVAAEAGGEVPLFG